MGIKFIHNSLSDFFTGEHLKQTIKESLAWQTSLDSFVEDKDIYSRWRSALSQLTELASDKVVSELIDWGENWRQRANLFGLDWLPRLYLSRGRYDELSKILTDLDFIEQKCVAGMTDDLVEDYNQLGVEGDKNNAILCGCGYNIHKLLRAFIFWLWRVLFFGTFLPSSYSIDDGWQAFLADFSGTTNYCLAE